LDKTVISSTQSQVGVSSNGLWHSLGPGRNREKMKKKRGEQAKRGGLPASDPVLSPNEFTKGRIDANRQPVGGNFLLGRKWSKHHESPVLEGGPSGPETNRTGELDRTNGNTGPANCGVRRVSVQAWGEAGLFSMTIWVAKERKTTLEKITSRKD